MTVKLSTEYVFQNNGNAFSCDVSVNVLVFTILILFAIYIFLQFRFIL